MWKKIKDFLYQDVSNENEVKMYAIIMRIILLIYALYCLTGGIYCATSGKWAMVFFYVACIVFSCMFFYETYHNRTRFSTVGTWIMLCLLMVMHSLYYGTNTGIYQAIYILIVMIFTLDYLQNYVLKILSLAFAIALRAWLGYYLKRVPTIYAISSRANNHWQAIHMFTFVAMVIVSVIVSTADFTEMRNKLQNTNKRFRDMAGKDPLTGLCNRRAILQYLTEQVDLFDKGLMDSLTVVMADIDHFKNVNDTYGHDNGDIVLTTISNDIGRFMRGKGQPARWGGEEFLLVFINHNGDDTYQMLFELQRMIADEEFNFGEDKLHITLTFGVAEHGTGEDIEKTIKESDERLYMGKESGRNKIVF